MKKYKRVWLLLILILTVLIVWIINIQQSKLTINQVNRDYIENQIIGSELPRIRFANKNKVIFENGGNIFLYDLIEQKMTLSLDIISFQDQYFSDEKSKDIRPWTYVTKNANEIIVTFNNYDFEPFDEKFYSFNISDKVITEISTKDFEAKKTNIFTCEYLKPDNKLYNKSTGKISRIDDKRFVYLAHDNYKVNSIKIILVDDNKKTTYNVFSTNK
ncbi:MAG: hypothetical protein N4A63_13610 [Vallitalea sp.]|jgi:hypothetical protein|nr:hypothetical protein [Vallitalea sp.]